MSSCEKSRKRRAGFYSSFYVGCRATLTGPATTADTGRALMLSAVSGVCRACVPQVCRGYEYGVGMGVEIPSPRQPWCPGLSSKREPIRTVEFRNFKEF